jgi:hypothetical protein
MNLQSRANQSVAGVTPVATITGFFRQIRLLGLFSPRLMIHLFDRTKLAPLCLITAALFSSTPQIGAQTNYYPANGTEYAAVGNLPGDQMFPDVALSSTGSFVVWQDNATDGDNWGISARRLDSTLSGTLGTFRINQLGVGSQERPRVSLQKNGGAVIVWQGGKSGFQHIYSRLLTSANTFLTTNDILVSTPTNVFQANPAVAVLANSNAVVVWSSFNQASSNSMQDIYGQLLSPSGQKIGGEFLVNQTTAFNQRTPAVTALAGGGFLVSWVSEQQRVAAPSLGTNNTFVLAGSVVRPSVDIYARLFSASAVASGNEFIVNSSFNPAANPAVAAASDGGFLIAWSAQDLAVGTNGSDIFARAYNSLGTAGAVFLVNSYRYGDQLMPRVSALGLEYFLTWTSLAQDGSREGVFARFVHNSGDFVGSEFRVNSTTAGQQLQPTVASDGVNQFLVVWSSYTGAPNNFDLFAQRYVNAAAVLQAMPAPFVWAPFKLVSNVYQPQLIVSWAPLLGLSVSNYEVYVDGSANPTGVVVSNQWIMTSAHGLTTNSTRSFTVDYVLTDGRRSPLSAAKTGTTWTGQSWGGIPFEWMIAYYGQLNVSFVNGVPTYNWPSPDSPLISGNNATLSSIFLSGGNPLNPNTWLKQQLTATPQGMFLSWNTQPGATYQVQVTTNLTTWSNVGSPRFAAGTSDSTFVGGSAVGYYRLQLMR